MPTMSERGETFNLVDKSPFSLYFVIFLYARYFYHTLLLLVRTFINVIYNICYDQFPVPQKFYSLFLKIIID